MSTLTSSAAWKALEMHQREMANVHMRDLFAQDPQRFHKFSLQFQDLLLDYSKNRITEKTMQLLRDLARQADLKGWTEKMFNGGEDQHHREPCRAPHRAAQPLQSSHHC